MSPSVRVVVAAFDAAPTLPALFDALRDQDVLEPFEVVVVDDGSTDATGDIARSRGARVLRQENRGPAAARNTGWRPEGARWILFTDSDCVPRRDWVRRMLEVLRADAQVVTGTYGIANRGQWLAQAIHDEIVWRHSRMREYVEFAGSFNLGAERSALEAVGGFDETFRSPSAEDNDLSYRWRDRGVRIRFVREAIVDHRHPTALAGYLREQSRHGYWRVMLYRSHPDRVRGDGYAGPVDFAAPILALASAAALPFSLASSRAFGFACLCFVLVVVLQNLLAARVCIHTGRPSGLALVGVGTLRSYARAWGLARGVVDLVRGKRGPR